MVHCDAVIFNNIIVDVADFGGGGPCGSGRIRISYNLARVPRVQYLHSPQIVILYI
jgi:hypothetical protein